jgi:Na+/melibiose symporter-like transporter
MPPSATRVPVPVKLSYGVGQLAEGVKNAAFGTFLLLYYNQVLGLSGSLAGTAIFIALCFDAVTDPLAGSVSDNSRSSWGRRHPFMYASALPLAIFFFALFTPPDGLGTTGLFAWLTTFTILTRAAMTLYHVPHLALGAELSDHYTERTTIVAYRQFFSILGILTVSALGYGVFFRDVGGRAGDLVAANYLPFAATLAVAMTVTILWSAIGTHAQIPKLPQTRHVERPGFSRLLRGVASDFGSALENRSFKWLAGATLSSWVMVGLQNALQLYIANFFWELGDNSKALLLMATPCGFFLGIGFTRAIHERIDKRLTMIAGSCLYLGFTIGPVALRLLDAFPANDSAGLTPTLVACGLGAGFGGVQAIVSGSSMMADVADEHELETGRRQEGVFFGAISFAGKGASGLGSMLGGFAIDAIGFPAVATPGEIAPGIVFDLGAVYGPMMTGLALLGVWCASHYRLTAEEHAHIAAALAARSGSAPPEGPADALSPDQRSVAEQATSN